METLKKAYAEIILNSSKEAAARIMAADRRARSFQKDLIDLREDALRMLVQLKQMLDFKLRWQTSASFISLFLKIFLTSLIDRQPNLGSVQSRVSIADKNLLASSEPSYGAGAYHAYAADVGVAGGDFFNSSGTLTTT